MFGSVASKFSQFIMLCLLTLSLTGYKTFLLNQLTLILSFGIKYYLPLPAICDSFIYSFVDQFKYVLEVTSMVPDIGSIVGGTKVTIRGEGFGTDASDVIIEFSDNITCEVESILNERIDCVIDMESTVHQVDNMGRHESKCNYNNFVFGVSYLFYI